MFPVHRPGGLKRAYWNFFFLFFNLLLFFLLPPPPPLYILVSKKIEIRKEKKDSRPPELTGNDFLLKGGLEKIPRATQYELMKHLGRGQPKPDQGKGVEHRRGGGGGEGEVVYI